MTPVAAGRQTVLMCSPGYWAHEHGGGHPLRAERLRRTYELLQAYKALRPRTTRLVAPRPAAEEELALFHTQPYIDAVRRLSEGDPYVAAHRFGFGPGDNPVFEGMYLSERLKVGGSLQGAHMLMRGEAETVFNFGGGLHHARPAETSGFCIFNDAVIAITWLVAQGARVAYVDIDVHHGDGVQWAFYDSDRVLTISLHQDGRTLFPGTGSLHEEGRDRGTGYAVNVPLPPGTDDSAYLDAFEQVAPPLVARFAPDVLVTQLGVDSHYRDPLAELKLTTLGQVKVVERMSTLCTRWLALGGGGYDLEVVPRAWTLFFGVMTGQEFPDPLPGSYRRKYGGETLRDRLPPPAPEHVMGPVRRQVEQVVEEIRRRHEL
ncbi:MAG: acetoin utilization protein AcuC [Chloroflexi bacterium]|nr:acetoin utilization protein AcuC [Chloroflexota bacterium]